MNVRTTLPLLALAGLAVAPALAGASSVSSDAGASLALGVATVTNELRGLAHGGTVHDRGYTNESIRYRPGWRRSRDDEWNRPNTDLQGFMQLQGGAFDPRGDVSNGVTFDLRVGSNFDDRVQAGAQVDWAHRSDTQTMVLGSGTLPGGGTFERERELSSVGTDLLPVLGFIQIAPTGTHEGPYLGVAGGYEALFVNATDATGADFSATYDGWGWQFYGGYAFPLSSTARLTIEGFGNQGKLGRDVDDPVNGSYREVVDVGGAGVRGGLSWSF